VVSEQGQSRSGTAIAERAPYVRLGDRRSMTGATAAGTVWSRGPGNERHGTAKQREAAAKGSRSQVGSRSRVWLIAVGCAGVANGCRKISRYTNGLEEKVQQRKLGRGARSASDGRARRRPAGCGRCDGRRARARAHEMLQTGERSSGRESKARGRHESAGPCRDEVIIASFS
jgi:hypothetical protein